MKLVKSAFECIYLTEIFPLYFGISLFYLGKFWYTRACLKKAFCKMCVTICGRFCPDEGAVAGYGNRIRAKYTAKWGVQIAGMIFQTGSSLYSAKGTTSAHKARLLWRHPLQWKCTAFHKHSGSATPDSYLHCP